MAAAEGHEMVDMTTKCSQCSAEFDDPRMLDCDHTFCIKCLTQSMAKQKRKKSVQCPLCKKETKLPDDKLECLPINTLTSEQQKTGRYYDQHDKGQNQDGVLDHEQNKHKMGTREEQRTVELTKQCSLCESEFDDLRQLACTHSFCLKCLRQHLVKQPNKKGVVCPQCKKRSRIPEGKLECLPVSMMSNEQQREKKTDRYRDQSQDQEGMGMMQETDYCGICRSEFEDPRQLTSCRHSFCFKCLKQYVGEYERKREIKCPRCDKWTPLHDGKLENLPTSAMYCEQNNTPSHTPTCQDQESKNYAFKIACSSRGCSRPAVSFCVTCTNMCTRCEIGHKKKYHHAQNHEIKTVDEGLQFIAKQMKSCSTHPNKCLEFYCKNCDKKLCSKCFTDTHSGHDYERLSEAMIDGAKCELQTVAEEIKKRLEICDTQIKEVEVNYSKLRQTADGLKDDAVSRILSIEDELICRKQEIDESVDTSYEEALNAQKHHHKSLKKLNLVLEGLASETSQLFGQETMPHFTQKVGKLRDKMLKISIVEWTVREMDTAEAHQKLQGLMLNRNLQALSETNADMKQEQKRLTHDKERWQDGYMKIKAENEDLQNKQKRLVQNNKELQTANKTKQKQFDDLKTKYNSLAENYGKSLALEVAMDDKKSENISTQCRPSVLHEIYVNLSYQNAGTVKSTIPTPSAEITKELKCIYIDEVFSAIYMTTCRHMTELHKLQQNTISCWLTQPVEASCKEAMPVVVPENKGQGNGGTPLVPSLLHDLTKYTKNVSGDVSMTSAIKPILDESLWIAENDMIKKGIIKKKDVYVILMRETLASAVSAESSRTRWCVDLIDWIRSLCNLAWQMSLQNPPMTMETPRIGKRVHLENDKIIPPKNMDFKRGHEYVIDYYLEPHLMHGEDILEAGRVKIRLQSKYDDTAVSGASEEDHTSRQSLHTQMKTTLQDNQDQTCSETLDEKRRQESTSNDLIPGDDGDVHQVRKHVNDQGRPPHSYTEHADGAKCGNDGRGIDGRIGNKHSVDMTDKQESDV